MYSYSIIKTHAHVYLKIYDMLPSYILEWLRFSIGIGERVVFFFVFFCLFLLFISKGKNYTSLLKLTSVTF